jgi:hypothetical protein
MGVLLTVLNHDNSSKPWYRVFRAAVLRRADGQLSSNKGLADFDRDLQLMSAKRNPLALSLAGLLLISITAFLVIIGWQREYIDAYLVTNPLIKSFENNNHEWRVVSARKADCGSPESCYEFLRSQPSRVISYDKLTGPWKDIATNISETEPVYILVQTAIPKTAWKELYDSGHHGLIVGMPTAWYDDAIAFVNGNKVSNYLKNSRIGVPVILENEPEKLVIDVMYQKSWHYTGLFEADDEPLLVATPADYRAWVRVLVMQSAHQGNWISNLSFIVMAVFFLLLYLFVDSSPEVLGLALFVGLDAFGRSLNYDWLPLPYTAQIADTTDSASQVMRLYFLLQLSRFGSSKVGPWLSVSFVYALLASAGSWVNALGWPIIEDRVYEINVWFSLVVAVIGIVLAGVSAAKLRSQRLPWRQWALVIAAIACFLQAIAYINNIWPEVSNYPEFYKVRSIIVPLSVFLLASSAFVNISTLENRVRVLSKAKAKNDEIEKELELGRVVQNAYMKIPNLPSEIDISCFFEAAFYVSGDAYFVHWDPDTKRLAVILGDMTGHGVHAALKATTLQVIARTIFRDPMRRSENLGGRFIVYEQALRSFLRDSWGDGDLPTFLGMELDFESGRVVSHRSNFPFPMILVQKDDGVWDVKVWSDHFASVNSRTDGKNMFLVSATDGVIGGSKTFNKIALRLKHQLNVMSDVNAERVKIELLNCAKEAGLNSDDDRTMVVFGLKRPKAAA